MKDFINGLLRPNAIFLSVVMYFIAMSTLEAHWFIALNVVCIVHIGSAIIFMLGKSSTVKQVVTRTVEKRVYSLKNIELDKPLYKLDDDKIHEYKPKAILATEEGLYVSNKKDFLELNQLIWAVESKRYYNYSYNTKWELDQMQKEILHYTKFIPYTNLYTDYDEALEARNDVIRKRIEREIKRIDEV